MWAEYYSKKQSEKFPNLGKGPNLQSRCLANPNQHNLKYVHIKTQSTCGELRKNNLDNKKEIIPQLQARNNPNDSENCIRNHGGQKKSSTYLSKF